MNTETKRKRGERNAARRPLLRDIVSRFWDNRANILFAIFPNEYDYELEAEELEAAKPYTAERRAEIDEICSDTAAAPDEINAM